MIKKLDLREFRAGDTLDSEHSSAPTKIWLTSDLRNFEAFWPRSDRLGKAQSWAFQCANVLEVWCDTFGAARHTQALFVAVVDAKDRALALLPLGIERRLGGIRVLTFLDGGVCDYNAPVLFATFRDWDVETTRALWRGLLKILPPFDVAVLEKMPAYVGELPNPLVHLVTRPFPGSGHAVVLSGSWANFAANRLPDQRNVKRHRLQLAKMGALKFEIATTREEYKVFLDAMIRQKSRRYIETRGVNGFDRPGARSYFQEFIYRLSSQRLLHLSVLKLDDTIIAAHWGLVVGRRFIT